MSYASTQQPLRRYVSWRGLEFLDAVVETFARVGSVTGAADELDIAGAKALGEFLSRIVGVPGFVHGGKRPGAHERTPYRHPAADHAARVWKQERPRVLALYGVTG